MGKVASLIVTWVICPTVHSFAKTEVEKQWRVGAYCNVSTQWLINISVTQKLTYRSCCPFSNGHSNGFLEPLLLCPAYSVAFQNFQEVLQELLLCFLFTDAKTN